MGGGMSRVFVAVDSVLRRRVAVTVLRPSWQPASTATASGVRFRSRVSLPSECAIHSADRFTSFMMS
jgi:hypothetical protein